jgi:hypothetical protein
MAGKKNQESIGMSSRTQRTFLQYRADDFPLYLFSLAAIGAVTLPAMQSTALRASIVVALLYMVWMFICKHGARFDTESLRVLLVGLAGYPRRVARNWWSVRFRVVQAVLLFALVLGVEWLLRPTLQGTRWLEAFPWRPLVWVPFMAITAFRIAILLAHLWRAKHVRDFLSDSPAKSSLNGASIYNHMIHGFITGMLSHLCPVALLVLFYRYTDPTYLRETLLLAGYVLWCAIAWKGGIFTPVERGGDGPPHLRGAWRRLFSENHAGDHRSRFYFTIFHGHHHDAISSAMIAAAGGSGPLESADRVVTWLDPLDSAILVQVSWTIMCIGDMVSHQYIPGVFPYSSVTVKMKNHHVAHHFGSLYPLGLFDLGNVESADYRAGYDPDNSRVRWYLDSVERYEGLTEQRREKFLSRNFVSHARIRLSLYTEADTAALDFKSETRSIGKDLDRAVYETPPSEQLPEFEALWMRSVLLGRRYPENLECAAWEGMTLLRYARALNDVTSMGLINDARKKLMAAISTDPTVLRGVAQLTLGASFGKSPGAANLRRALAHLEKAVSIEPDGLEQNVGYGEVLMRGAGHREKARKILERALSAPPLEGREAADRALRARAAELLQSLAPATRAAKQMREAAGVV